MSQWKPSHEVEITVRRPVRQNCVKTQIWGRMRPQEHFCGIERAWKPFLFKRHMTAKKHLNDCQTMGSKIMWSDETRIELLATIPNKLLWRKPGTEHRLINIFFTVFLITVTGRIVRIEGNGNIEKSRVETFSRDLRISRWGEDLHFNKTTT